MKPRLPMVWLGLAVLSALALTGCSRPFSFDSLALSVIAPPPKVRVTASPGAWTSFDLFDDSRIILKGRANGLDADIMLDSGAGMTTLDAAFAAKLGLKPGMTVPIKGAVGSVKGRMMKGLTLEVAGIRLENMTVLVIDLSPVAKALGRPIPVVLGREAFEPLIADLDLPNHRLAFRDRKGWTPPPGAVRLPFTVSGEGQRSFPITLEDRPPVLAHFDLGNGGPLFLRPAYWGPLDLTKGRSSSMTLTGGVGGMKAAAIVTLRDIKVGGVTLPAVPTVLSPGGGADTALANVGYPVLSRFHLYTDYRGNGLYLIPDPAARDQPFRRNRAGLGLEPAGDRQRVVLVAPGSPAEAAGWKVGDEIVAVDGQTFGADVGASPLNRWTTGPAGETRALTLADGGIRRLTLADYY